MEDQATKLGLSEKRSLALLGVALVLGCAPPSVEPGGSLDAGPIEVVHSGPPTYPDCEDPATGATLGEMGPRQDTGTIPTRRVVLMGGSAEVDTHAKAFVEGAAGGDVLVMRASGSVESYTPYFFDELGADPAPSSSRTLRLDEPSAGNDAAVQCFVDQSEALWLAGGDQWDYLGLWPSALHEKLAAATSRGIAMGGTSAGAMALGQVAFDAEEGSITSDTALSEPTHFAITLSPSPFHQPELDRLIVDTHFSQRGRVGRLLVFLAHARDLLGEGAIMGMGIDERTSVVIEDGQLSVLSTDGGAAHLYRWDGTATLEAGEPLQMEGLEWVRIGSGTSIDWPPDFAQLGTEGIEVINGTVYYF